jgi:transcriptional regulator with XRE-family HTH domain
MALRNQDIADRIKALREQRGNPPQPVVAAAIHVSLRTYQNWEGGDAKPEYRNLESLAAYYGVSEQFILSGDSAPREDPVVVSETVEGGFEEFREYVREIKAEIQQNRLEIEQQNRLLATQSALLDQQTEILAQMREALRLLPAVQALLEAEAEASGHPPVELPGRVEAAGPDGGEGHPRRTG